MSRNRHDEWIVVTDDAKTIPVIEVLTGRGFVTGKSGSGKSVLEGTIVYTEDGRKPIEHVERGERVLSLDTHDGEQEFREVRAIIEHESDRLLCITLEDGSQVIGTEDHSFLTIENAEIVPIRGDELTEGTWFPLARELPSIERIAKIDLTKYSNESEGGGSGEFPNRSGLQTDDDYLSLTFDTGKLLGLYLATGSLDARSTVEIVHRDPDVKSFLKAHGFDAEAQRCVRSFRPFGRFIAAEFGRDSAVKRLPNWVFESPDPFKAGLLSGYVDGAGTVEDTVSVPSESPGLCRDVKELLRHFGIAATLRQIKTTTDVEEGRCVRLRVDASNMPALLGVLDLTVEEKKRALETAVDALASTDSADSRESAAPGPVLHAAQRRHGSSTRERRSADVTSRSNTHEEGPNWDGEWRIEGRAERFASADVDWKRITDIEVLDERRRVYDLDVRKNDTFIADGVFVHNSNTGGVIAEELLESGYNLLIVDTEGEYFGLKERYELLHVGADDFADVQVSPSHAEKIAEVALKRNMPIILDVSGYFDGADAEALIEAVLEHLYRLEKEERKPFLIMIEEMQEYLPQQGGGTDLAALIERIAKRGRKRGLGLCGMSQRPSSVDKDFITQCDWMVWHRLTWETDLNVVRNILGADRADDIQEFDPGEGILMTDWDDTIETVRFKRKRTHDAGATPGLESYERPDLQTVGSELVREIKGGDAPADIPEPTVKAEPAEPDEPEEVTSELAEDVAETEAEPEEPTNRVESPPADEQRAELLAAEVNELRSILEGVERRDEAPTVPANPNGVDPDIDPPTPPRRPTNRSGAAGNLIEFCQMLIYLARVAWYRIRLRYHYR